MTPPTAIDIPYEPQHRSRTDRMCGAAALAMVYRSLGIESAQALVWEQIARPDRLGHRAARTYLLAQSALCHGLAAVCLEAGTPWMVLERAAAAGVRVILNHRLLLDSPAGHYSVLAGIHGDEAILHDPQFGPGRRIPRGELLALWGPAWPSEIVGHVLVAVGPLDSETAVCAACGTAWPEPVACPRCKSPIPLQPAGVLGCIAAGCAQRAWKRLFCPYCDASVREVPGC